MKWFQHQSDASDDIKIKRLEYKLGITAYAVYFKTLEKVAKEGKNHCLEFEKFPIGLLANDFRIKEEELNDILTEMGKLGLIVRKVSGICVPKMKKYVGNWDRRKQEQLPSNYGVTNEPLPKEKNRTEKNRKEETALCSELLNWNKSQSSPIQGFAPQNIINKHGYEKIAAMLKTYGKENGGFHKFLMALKN